MIFYRKKFEKYWREIVEDFCPDVVNIHGTEYCHGLSFIKAFPNFKTVISLQGIMGKIQYNDFAGISKWDILKSKTLSEWVKFNGIYEYHVFHKKNAKTEAKMIRSVQYCMAVDDWHYSIATEINPKLKIFKIGYNLRKEFYESAKWDINTIDRHVITTNPGGTPLKGIHMLLRAVALVKIYFPNVKVKVPGMQSKQGELVVNSGYAKYLKKLILKLGIQENVEFLGPQTTEQMINNMLKAHVQVVPSSIEGPSLVLHEGMFLGVPSIATFRGGMADFITDKIDGFLYDFTEYQYLALRIMQIFRDDDLAKTLSENAIKKAEINQDREYNYLLYMKMYQEIIKD